MDVAPRDIEVGDQIEVIGSNLPSGNVKEARVSFVGKLYRPGLRKPIEKTIEVHGAKPSPDKVTLVFTDALQREFCEQDGELVHTTFRGDVTVTFPAATDGTHGVQGSLLGVMLDIRPPSARRIVIAAREKEGENLLSFLGVTVGAAGGSDASGDGPSDGDGVVVSGRSNGLVVSAVEAASPADRAMLRVGDHLVSFNGVKVSAVADLVPPPGASSVDFGIKRGQAEPVLRQIDLDGYQAASLPADALGAAAILGVAALIRLIFLAPTAGIITWVERRVSARMQSRVGPNRAGPQGFLIWIADGIKSITKEDIVPTESDQALFRLAPYLVFIGVSATFVVMPFGQYLIAADLDIGILFVIAVTSLVAIGLMTGGWASNNKWSLLGGIRAAAQVISYEIPAAVAIVCVVMMTGSLRMQDIIIAQGGLGDGGVLATGGWPWYWFVFRNPVTFALFFLFFTTALAEGNRAPFDLPEAESELVAGYSTEYSGMRYLFFFFAEWANVFVFCGIASALFLGGWQIPGISPQEQEASVGLQILGCFLFLLKSWILIFIVIWIRWTLPRVRIDQLMNLCWKWFVPLSFAAFTLCALWVLATDPTPVFTADAVTAGAPLIPMAIQTAIGVATFAMSLLFVVHFARRVLFNVRASKVPVHLNPFL